MYLEPLGVDIAFGAGTILNATVRRGRNQDFFPAPHLPSAQQLNLAQRTLVLQLPAASAVLSAAHVELVKSLTADTAPRPGRNFNFTQPTGSSFNSNTNFWSLPLAAAPATTTLAVLTWQA